LGKAVAEKKPTNAASAAFAKRLIQACDQSSTVPPHGQGRQITIAKRLGVTQEAVRKWFAAEAIPRQAKMKELASVLEVEEPWLALGITPELNRAEKRLRARNIDGAVLLVMGLNMLAGASCAQPGEKDPKREYVDFYSILRGSQFAVHVTLAREVSPGSFEMMLPKEFRDVRNIAVIPVGKGKYDFVDLVVSRVDEHKARKAGDYALVMGRMDGRYITGNYTWTRIKNFEELA
jgi:transcriptional regulator with XRE-family HTH domain